MAVWTYTLLLVSTTILQTLARNFSERWMVRGVIIGLCAHIVQCGHDLCHEGGDKAITVKVLAKRGHTLKEKWLWVYYTQVFNHV